VLRALTLCYVDDKVTLNADCRCHFGTAPQSTFEHPVSSPLIVVMASSL
jgi:hypothetical protein